MARLRRREPSPVEEPEERTPEQTMEDSEDAPQPLKFNEPLTWRAGKPIAIAELQRRLKALYAELAPMTQEEADRETLEPVAKELANANLLSHKDKGIKAYTALCIVEMFKLLAPDAPYTGGQLKATLGNPSDPYNEQHLQVLRSLDEVKSIVLLSDIPGSDALIVKLFAGCFDTLSGTSRIDSGEELSKNVEYHMTRMLSTLVDECESLPSQVIDTILAQFLRTDPSTFPLQTRKNEKHGMLQLQQLPPPYNMAKSICNSSPEKMSRCISQYFSSIMLDTSETVSSSKVKKLANGKRRRGSDESEDEDDARPVHSEEDYKELRKGHRLLRELWRSAPDVLQNLVPHLETELSAENVQLRLLATETIGDLISGIGAAGPPAPPKLDPTAYPSQSVDQDSDRMTSYNFLTSPSAPHAFSSTYPTTYQNFVNRQNDKTAQVRSMWVACVGRILTTSAGGIGLDPDEQQQFLRSMASMLVDHDERVRLAAVQAIARFSFEDIIQKLGSHGSVTDEGSVLANLTDRIKDRKHNVRVEAMELLGRLWGVAAGAITEGSERFPPIKSKGQQQANGSSQRVRDSQQPAAGASDERPLDADVIRAQRLLVLVRDLEQKAKTVFYALQGRQAQMAKWVEAFLIRCEAYNGGVAGKGSKEAKDNLEKYIDALAKTQPDVVTASDNLWKFAKVHDRRCYQLTRFAMDPDSDYRRVYKSIRELTKRIEDAGGNKASMLTTLTPLLQQSSVVLYNKSHVPAIMEFSRTDDGGLAAIAHEVLNQISTVSPAVFKAHVRELCVALEKQAPKPGETSDPGTVETLKACAGFAQRYPSEMPRDTKFLQSMVQFAVHGNPKAAKHAVTVVSATEERRDMYIKEIVTQCVENFTYGANGSLSKLAAISQLMLVAAGDIEDKHDAIKAIAIGEVLLKVRVSAKEDDPAWQDDVDDDCAAKLWALKILANQLRWYATSAPTADLESSGLTHAKPVYKLLFTIVEGEGEISKKKDTPAHHKSQLRLASAILLLKLSSSSKHFDSMLTPSDFNKLATITQDALPEVRSSFVEHVKKYLGQARLPVRFYALVFMYAFEPKESVKHEVETWLRARAAASAKLQDTVMEATFARFLSLLAHHPDFSMEVEHLEDFVEYILFYLRTVASQRNLPLIFTSPNA
ncbi:Sister chromatid cohesion protein pds5 [Taxawa tesnikishii (nom. ined.)]|nr:Sister chromatid cohesion protein pds5 [Dothideales sp. JES 119]